MKIYLINRACDTRRLAFQTTQLNRLGLPFERVSAIDASQLAGPDHDYLHYEWQRPLRTTEVGCALSHLHIWRTIYSCGETALILEDDAYLSDTVPDILTSLKKSLELDFVNLETRERTKDITKSGTDLIQGYSLHRLRHDRGGATAYVLSPLGAKRLLTAFENNGLAPADAALTNCRGLRRAQVCPAPVIQLSLCQAFQLDFETQTSSTIFGGTPSPKPRSFCEFLTMRKRRIFGQIRLLITAHLPRPFLRGFHSVRVPVNSQNFSSPRKKSR